MVNISSLPLTITFGFLRLATGLLHTLQHNIAVFIGNLPCLCKGTNSDFTLRPDSKYDGRKSA